MVDTRPISWRSRSAIIRFSDTSLALPRNSATSAASSAASLPRGRVPLIGRASDGAVGGQAQETLRRDAGDRKIRAAGEIGAVGRRVLRAQHQVQAGRRGPVRKISQEAGGDVGLVDVARLDIGDRARHAGHVRPSPRLRSPGERRRGGRRRAAAPKPGQDMVGPGSRPACARGTMFRQTRGQQPAAPRHTVEGQHDIVETEERFRTRRPGLRPDPLKTAAGLVGQIADRPAVEGHRSIRPIAPITGHAFGQGRERARAIRSDRHRFKRLDPQVAVAAPWAIALAVQPGDERVLGEGAKGFGRVLPRERHGKARLEEGEPPPPDPPSSIQAPSSDRRLARSVGDRPSSSRPAKLPSGRMT